MAGNTTYRPDVSNSTANTIQYAINQVLLNVNTIQPCQIVEISGNLYTVQILTNYIDSNGTPFPAPKIYDIPAMQIRGKNAGIITEYSIGDAVLVGFCQRDISTVKKNWAEANPGSLGRFRISDGIILGYLGNDEPDVYVKITADGIEIKSNNNNIKLDAGSAVIDLTAQQVNLNSDDINLGVSGVGILNANTQFIVSGIQLGSDSAPVEIVTGTESSKVKAV